MRKYYPKFLAQKPLVMGFKLNDVIVLAFVVMVLNLSGCKHLTLAITIGGYITGVWFFRKNYPRNHFYYYLESRKSKKWFLAFKDIKRGEK